MNENTTENTNPILTFEGKKYLINELSKRKENLLKDKSPNSLIALGAMEVHLNLALQALNAFNKGVNE